MCHDASSSSAALLDLALRRLAALPAAAAAAEVAAAEAAEAAAKKDEADDIDDLALEGRCGGSLVPLAVANADATPESGCGLAKSGSDDALDMEVDDVDALSRLLKWD